MKLELRSLGTNKSFLKLITIKSKVKGADGSFLEVNLEMYVCVTVDTPAYPLPLFWHETTKQTLTLVNVAAATLATTADTFSLLPHATDSTPYFEMSGELLNTLNDDATEKRPPPLLPATEKQLMTTGKMAAGLKEFANDEVVVGGRDKRSLAQQ